MKSRETQQMNLFAKQKNRDTEATHICTKRGRRARMNREIGIDIYTLLVLCIK